ncbi:hypothetical protein [Massilia sp. MP_M2]|uniref:hypothetical protein n=1 Tax=Massilia sp. MP_M2 TaxID=3071713 RepID=UPI00319E1E88
MADSGTRTLLYCWVSNGFSVLVPKRRGTGYLKVPYGHHHIDGLTAAANAVGCDVVGLDGELAFESRELRGLYCARTGDARAIFIAKLMPLLERHYQMDSREVDAATFWQLHPLTE